MKKVEKSGFFKKYAKNGLNKRKNETPVTLKESKNERENKNQRPK